MQSPHKTLWRDGQLDHLLAKGRTLQERLSKRPPGRKKKERVPAARLFADKMFQGKVKSSLDMLTNKSRGGLLQLNDMVTCPEGEMSVRDINFAGQTPLQQTTYSRLFDK